MSEVAPFAGETGEESETQLLAATPTSWWGLLRSRIALGIACASLVSLTAITCYDIFCRYFLNAPTRWKPEIAPYLMAIVVMFGAAHALSVGAHVRVDLYYERLAGRKRAFVDLVAWISGAVFCAVLAWQSAALAFRSFTRNAHSMDLQWPLALPQSLVTMGSAMLMIECLILAVKEFRRVRRLSA